MKVRGGYEQSYNAQAAVEVSTLLIIGAHVTGQANDKQQLVATLAVVRPVIHQVANVLVASGYYSENAIQAVESAAQPVTGYAAMKRQSHGRSIAQFEVREDPPPPPPDAPVAERMAHRLDTDAGKQLSSLRKQTVEPVFGIIKEAIGFRRFLLRGEEKVSLEWTLVSTSDNLRRVCNLGMSLQRA